MYKPKRLYIFTGKGGVGKTLTSLAFAKKLQADGHKALYTYFSSSKLDETSKSFNGPEDLAKKHNIQTLSLELTQSAKGYIAQKLKSETIAGWMIKTPFFKSAINMIPGFNYLIYLGQIVQLLEDDPSLTIILDSPSSGHAQTMLEATKNFGEIFQSGVLFEDTNRIAKTINSKNYTKVNIITLPSNLAIHEAVELETALGCAGEFEMEIFCNNCLINFAHSDNLPETLKSKVKNEQMALDNAKFNNKQTLPYITSPDIIEELLPYMESLV